MRYSFRGLVRSPGFSATVVLALAVGLGANFLIFWLLNAFLLRPLPVWRPEQLVHFLLLRSNNIPGSEFMYLDCQILQRRAKSFEAVFASGDVDLNFASGDRTVRVFGQQVSANFTEALGVTPVLGIAFNEADDQAGRYPVMLSYGLWQREFGGRADVIGQVVHLRNTPFTIAAVLPRDFRGMDLDSVPDVYIPYWSVRRWNSRPIVLDVPVHIYGRLRPGVAIEQARAEFEQLYPEMIEAEIALLPDTGPKNAERTRATARAHRPWLEDASGGKSGLRSQFSLALRALMGAVGVLLLLVCANVGGLMLARSEARRQHIAIRLSLGASRPRVVSIVLWDSVLLVSAGLIGAMAIVHWGAPALLHVLPSRRPLALEPGIDWNLLAFAGAICAATALLMSVIPAVQVMRADLAGMMGRGGSRVRRTVTAQVFIGVQVALATVLTIGSVVLAQTLDRLRRADPGFVRDHMIVVELDPRASVVKPGEQEALINSIVQRTKELPRVRDVSVALGALMRGLGLKNTVAPAGRQTTANDFLNSSLNLISPNHLGNLNMRIIAGRALAAPDALAKKPTPVVVTRSFANRFFPGLDPLGQRFGAGVNTVVGSDYEIVGVVADTKYRSMREEAPPTFFLIAGHDDIDHLYSVILYIRVRDDTGRTMADLRGLLSRAGAPPASMASLEQEIESSLWRERLLATFSSVFAAIAALLPAAGLYGMLAHSIRRRTREIGIRIALGAGVTRIAGLVGRDVAVCLFPGLLAGILLYFGCSRYIAPLLYGVRALELPPLAAGVTFIAIVAVLSGLIPARRAIGIHPAEALREE